MDVHFKYQADYLNFFTFILIAQSYIKRGLSEPF